MDSSYKKILHASLLIALSGVLYGFLGYLGTNVLQENLSISDMLFWRFFIAGSWMLLFASRNSSIKKVFQQIDLRVLIFMFFLGAIGYAGSSEFYFIASQYTGTGLAMVIFFSYPIIIALMSWISQPQRFNKFTLLILFTMMIGLFLLKDSANQSLNWWGIFFAIISALCYAFYVIGSKRFSSRIDSNLLTTIVCYGCAFICLLVSISSHSFVLPHAAKSWINLFALGIFATALPIQLMLKGLQYVSSMRASIISVLEPLVTVFVGVILLNESISHLQILGVIIILASALLVQFQKEL